MTKGLKKVFCVFGATACVLGSAMSASAIEFDVTPPNDPYSYTVKKEDSEQLAYVTATYFSRSSALYAYSQQCNNHGIRSETMTITPTNKAKKAAYKQYARPNVDYEMYSYATVSGLNVCGRYTP